MALTRKRRKRRAPGTGCQLCRRDAVGTEDGHRLCSTHLADRLTANFVKARDGRCVRCGSLAPLDWAHVIGRSYKAVRWSVGDAIDDPWNNSVALCRACHAWQTYHPLEGEEFFASLGIDLVNLRYLALHDPPQDPDEVIARYRPVPEEAT